MSKAPKLNKLYHFSYPARDAEETRAFYEDLLGLKMTQFMQSDRVPSTGEDKPYAHFFFEMGDGSYIAFFDLGENQQPLPSPNTPDWVQHFAIEVDTVEEVQEMKRRLDAAGVENIGVVDHHFIKSVYFFDPNGLRLEVTTRTEEPGFLEKEAKEAHEGLRRWNEKKRALLARRSEAAE